VPRHVDVRILGRVGDIKGINWPTDPRLGFALSAGLEEPCDLTIRLPSGKIIAVRTRPILFVRRTFEDDTVMSVFAPPEGKKGSLADKGHEVERLLSRLGVVPDARMRAMLDEWETPVRPPVLVMTPTTQQTSAPTLRPITDPALLAIVKSFQRAAAEEPDIPTMIRTGTDLDDRTQIAFRVEGSNKSGWDLVVEIEAKQAEWERVWHEDEKRKASATRPTTQPAQQP
jgi:hypothetical protein